MDGCMYLLAFTSYNATFSISNLQFSVFMNYNLKQGASSVVRSPVRFTLGAVVSFSPVDFSTWSLSISRCHRVGPSMETSAIFIGLSQPSGSRAPCLHCRLSPVCKKRLCLYLQFVQAADIPAPPSPLAPISNRPREIHRATLAAAAWRIYPTAVTQPHSIISTSSDSALDTFNQVPSARITTVFIKIMSRSGAWADLQVRTPSWSWRLHEITIYDLHQHLYGQSWSLNDNWLSIFCLHRERGHIRFHRPSWIIAFPPLLLQKNGWSAANLVQHLKGMPSWHLSAVVWAFLRLAFSCSIWLRLTNCCYYLLCSPQPLILFPPAET